MKCLLPVAPTRRDPDVLLMNAENCYWVSQKYRAAETWMWIWLLRLAGAPA